MKIKHSVTSSPKVCGTFFLKKLCMGKQTFFRKSIGGMLDVGANDQITQGIGKVSHKYFLVI